MSDRNVRTLKKTTDKQDLSLLIKSLIKRRPVKKTSAPEGIHQTTSARLLPVEKREHFDKLSSTSFIQDPLDVIKKLRSMSLRKHKSKDKSSLLELRRKHHARNSTEGSALPIQKHPFSLQSFYAENLTTTRSKTEILNSQDEPTASESFTETSTTTTSNTTSKRRGSHTRKEHVPQPPLPAQNAKKKTRKSSMFKNKRAFGTKTGEPHRYQALRKSKEKAMDASSTFAEINKRKRRLQETITKITASQRFLRSSRKTSSGKGSIVGMLMANRHFGHKSSKHRDSTPRTSLKGIDLAKLGYASQSLLQARHLESEIERNHQSLTARMADADNNMGHNLITPSIKLHSSQSAFEVGSRTDSKEAGHSGVEEKQGNLRTSGSAVAVTDSSSRKKEVRFDLVHTYRAHSFSGIEDASKKLPSVIKASMSQPNIYLKGRRIHPRKIWRSSGRVTYSNAGISREDWIEPGAKDGVRSLNAVNSQKVSASYSFEIFKLSSKNLRSNKHSIRRAFGVRLAKKFIKENFLRIRGSLPSDNINKLLTQTPEINLNLRSLQPSEQEEYYVKVDEQMVLLTKADELYIATPIAADITTTELEMEKPDILTINCFVYPSIWLVPLTSFDEEGSAITEEVNWMSAVESERHLVQLSLSNTTQHYVATKITRNTLKKILKEVGYDFEPHMSDVVNELLKLNTTRHSIAGERDSNSSLPPAQEKKHHVDGFIPVKRNRSKSEGYNKLKESFINKTKKQFTGLLNQYIGLFHDAVVPKIKRQLEEFGVPNTAFYNRILEASLRQCLWLMVKTKIDPFLQPVHEKNCALAKQPLFLEALEEMIEKIELGAEQGSVILAIDTVLRLIGTCKCKMSENVNSMISNGCTEFVSRVQGENTKKKLWSFPPTTKKAAYIAKIVDAACDWLPQLLALAKHYPKQAIGQSLNVHIGRAEASKQERPKREIAVARRIKTKYGALQTTMKSSLVHHKHHAQVDIGEHSPKAKLSSGRLSSAGSFDKKVDDDLPDNEQLMSEKLKDEEGLDEETTEDDEKANLQSLPKIKREARSKRKQKSRSDGILEDDEDGETNSDVQEPTTLSHTTPKINTQSVAASSKTAGRDSGLASTKMTSVGLPELEDSPNYFDMVTPSVNDRQALSMEADYNDSSTFYEPDTNSYHINVIEDDGERDDSKKGTFRTQLSSLMQMSNAKSEQWLNDNILPPIQQADANRRQSDKPIIDSVEKRKATKFTDEQGKLVEDHLKSLESDRHSFKSLHGMSEVAVTDLVRGLWNKPEETEEWHGKYKEHTPPQQAKTKGESVPRLPQLSRVTGGLEFQWDSPLPPAPGSKLSLTDWKDMHSKYCGYWRMVRKRMHHYTNTSKDVHSQSLQPPEDCGPKEDLLERLRLYPSHTDMTLRQLQTNTIDPEHWYPLYRYPSSFNIKESLPCATSSTLEVNDIS